MIRKVTAFLTPVLVVSATAGLAQAQGPQAPKGTPAPADTLPAVVARVNGTAISSQALKDATQAAAVQLQMMGGQMPAGGMDAFQRGILDDLIALELLGQEATRRKLTPTEKEIDDRIKEFKGMFPSDQVYQDVLKNKGVSPDQVREDIKSQLSISKLLEKEVESKIKIADTEIQSFYNENKKEFRQPETAKASHILIKVAAGASDEERAAAKKKAEGLKKRALKGEDFATLAKENSDDPGSKDKGGDLGEFQRTDMVKPFADAVFATKAGQISPNVVETQFGYHIIKVHKVNAAKTLALSEVKSDISEFLKAKKAQELAKTYVEKLRSKAKVQVYL